MNRISEDLDKLNRLLWNKSYDTPPYAVLLTPFVIEENQRILWKKIPRKFDKVASKGVQKVYRDLDGKIRRDSAKRIRLLGGPFNLLYSRSASSELFPDSLASFRD